ncbi:MAG: MmcQ/YjbR family DNA-binding protein [Pseudonocardia sp.]|nr:MmcQ/YjbR family DNA-binding protein [Pseudonocardia sp.]
MPSWDDVVRIGCALPEVEESTSYRTPSLKVRGKGFARLRTEAEGGLMLTCPMEEKEALLSSGDPAFYTTPHYDGYGSILIDLTRIDLDQLAELVEDAWRGKAPKTVLRRHDGKSSP